MQIQLQDNLGKLSQILEIDHFALVVHKQIQCKYNKDIKVSPEPFLTSAGCVLKDQGLYLIYLLVAFMSAVQSHPKQLYSIPVDVLLQVTEVIPDLLT